MSDFASPHRSPRVLVVDDEGYVRAMLCDLLSVWGCRADGASSGAQGLALLERERYDLVVTDFRMPGMTGMELVEHIRARDAQLRVIMLTASAGTLEPACGQLDVTLLRKPLEIERLKSAVHQALDRPPVDAAPAAAARNLA
jgi:CheY-like chemotaxis protein